MPSGAPTRTRVSSSLFFSTCTGSRSYGDPRHFHLLPLLRQKGAHLPQPSALVNQETSSGHLLSRTPSLVDLFTKTGDVPSLSHSHHKGSPLTFSSLLRGRLGALRMCEKAVLVQIQDLGWAVYPEPEAGVRMHMPPLPCPSVGEQRPEAGL